MISIFLYLAVIAFLAIWVESSYAPLNNPLILRRSAGEELDDWLKKFRWGVPQEVARGGHLPTYKFYSDVVEVLLSLARKMGGNYQDSMLFLREGLQLDRQFEKKLKEAILGCWLQMLMVTGLTWAFILGALHLVDVEVSTSKLILIAGWQGCGLVLLPFLIKFFRTRLFGDIGRLWKMLYILKSLARVPLSRSEIFKLAEVQELEQIHQKALLPLVEKLKGICEKALKIGGTYEEEVRYLMEELRFQEKWHFELFEKRLVAIKLGLLSIFFLPAYLAFIFVLLGELMVLM